MEYEVSQAIEWKHNTCLNLNSNRRPYRTRNVKLMILLKEGHNNILLIDESYQIHKLKIYIK